MGMKHRGMSAHMAIQRMMSGRLKLIQMEIAQEKIVLKKLWLYDKELFITLVIANANLIGRMIHSKKGRTYAGLCQPGGLTKKKRVHRTWLRSGIKLLQLNGMMLTVVVAKRTLNRIVASMALLGAGHGLRRCRVRAPNPARVARGQDYF